MPTLKKEFGITMPFETDGIVAYGKTYVGLEIDLDVPLGPQLEKAIKVNSIIDDVLIKVTDANLRRTQKEYQGIDPPDGGETVVDISDLMNQVANALHSQSLE